MQVQVVLELLLYKYVTYWDINHMQLFLDKIKDKYVKKLVLKKLYIIKIIKNGQNN